MISFDEVFSSVKQYCREKGAIPDVAVKLWINALHPVRLDGNVALFTVQSSFQRDVILGNYGDLLKEAFLNTLGLAVDIQIQVVDEEDQEVQEKFKTNDYDEIARRHEELEHTFEGANYEYTFDTFIVGGSNEFAYAACTAVAKEPGKNYNPLFIYGPSGLGKTHLSAAIAREVSEKGHSVVYDTAGHIFAQFEQQKFTREEEADDHVERVLNCDLLILDDLGSEMTTSFVQSALYQIVNTRQMERRSTIISTNLTPGELARRYTPQIASRIEGEYTLLPFAGEDIRKLKKERARGN